MTSRLSIFLFVFEVVLKVQIQIACYALDATKRIEFYKNQDLPIYNIYY
jgi:hypothetical protein